MATNLGTIRGVIHGKSIELDDEPGLPDGQPVTVTLLPVLSPGEGIRQSAGAWADGGEELERWLDGVKQSRQQDRPEPS